MIAQAPTKLHPFLEKLLEGGTGTFEHKGMTWHRLTYRGGIRAAHCRDTTVVEQNPATGSRYAQMARQGHKIAWVIQTVPGGRDVWKAYFLDDKRIKLQYAGGQRVEVVVED